MWGLKTGEAVRTLTGHSAQVSSVAVTPDGRQAISASHDHTLKVWDLESGREPHTLQGHSNAVLGAAVRADGRRAGSASWDQTLKVWDLETGALVGYLHLRCSRALFRYLRRSEDRCRRYVGRGPLSLARTQ